MTAHPPRIRWHVETYDPTAREWSAGLPLRNQHAAVRKLNHLTTTDPTWPDGTARVRRLVLETTTFQDLTTAAPLPRFPRGGFIYTDHADQDLGAVPDQTPDGRPAIRVIAGSHEVGHAEATLPLDRLEEVIAGMRDTARQTGTLRVELNGQDVTAEIADPAAEVLRIVTDWYESADSHRDLDPDDLRINLEKAGYPLPDDEVEEP